MSEDPRRRCIAYFRNRKTTDKEESALLRSLTPPHSSYSFRRYCNDHEDIFGEAGSSRKKYRDRRHRIRLNQHANFEDFKVYCDILEVDCPNTLGECTFNEETSDAVSPRFEEAAESHHFEDKIRTPPSTKTNTSRKMSSSNPKAAPLALSYDDAGKFYFHLQKMQLLKQN
jgi:hypothetical protein